MGGHEFIEASSFSKKSKFGKIRESDRERLEFDIMLGKGDVIPGTGGLKQIRCGLGGCYGATNAWQVVFADYPEYSITFLLIRFPGKYKQTLTAGESTELKKIKRRLDRLMGKHYGKGRHS